MNLLKFLINDVKEDLKTVKELVKGEYKSKYKLRDIVRVDWPSFLKKYWLFFLIIVLAFFVGYYFCAQHYQNLCNQFIIDNDLIERPVGVVFKAFKNITI